jgi:hypothetical protein
VARSAVLFATVVIANRLGENPFAGGNFLLVEKGDASN